MKGIFIAVFVLWGAGMLQAQAKIVDKAQEAAIKKAELGPRTIDVSHYPKKIRYIYNNYFTQECVQCHPLSLPINSDYALPVEWEGYIKRMMYKSGSNISMGDAKKITEFMVYDSSVRKKTMMDKKLEKIADFLIYDSSVRKKALVEDKLQKEAPSQRATQEAKIKEIHDKYDP
ncbi:MAG: hypothetical protein KGK03_10945 [Candidatus Omnitrophica bacterium]|nr:hypothetical protein [Candidatus Omnitrophota bacterium]